jgi:hypothetical protein
MPKFHLYPLVVVDAAVFVDGYGFRSEHSHSIHPKLHPMDGFRVAFEPKQVHNFAVKYGAQGLSCAVDEAAHLQRRQTMSAFAHPGLLPIFSLSPAEFLG